jgi:hypothetical protein
MQQRRNEYSEAGPIRKYQYSRYIQQNVMGFGRAGGPGRGSARRGLDVLCMCMYVSGPLDMMTYRIRDRPRLLLIRFISLRKCA